MRDLSEEPFIPIAALSLLAVDHINAQLSLPTGGHVEPAEHPRATALREAKEELSIDAEFHAAQWFYKGEVPLARTDRHMARFLRKLYPE